MALRKSPTMTPARLEANRRNARKSTGPRTARGKSQSRMNSLRTGGGSALHANFFLLLLDGPSCAVDRVARALLTPEQAAQPLFAETVDMFSPGRKRDGGAVHVPASTGGLPKKKICKICERSLNVIENTARWF